MTRSLDSPLPRNGLPGLWDRLVGPGMSAAENALVLTTGFLGAAAAALWLAASGASPPAVALGAVLGLDVIGGAVCNATDTTKRWYHRPETGAARHVSFVSSHLIHVALVAWMLRGDALDGTYFGVVGGWLVVSAALVLATPASLKRPVAAALYLVAVALALYAVEPTPGLEWFVPALFLKLLVGHLVPERPSRRSD